MDIKRMNVYPTVEEASDENNCIGRPIRSRLLHIYTHTCWNPTSSYLLAEHAPFGVMYISPCLIGLLAYMEADPPT